MYPADDGQYVGYRSKRSKDGRGANEDWDTDSDMPVLL
jgi:hypothetical protein